MLKSRLLCFVVAMICGPQAPVIADQPDAASAQPLFREAVVPFLRLHCHRCHGGEEPEGGLSLDQYRESANIQTDFETWEQVLRLITDRQMPPEDEPQPKEHELRSVTVALEAELAKFDCRSERHPGRVTVRRLNRAEYNNTIRDLVGIDHQPANDFPADDVGYGFDNIGDVLAIPPILLEKYLAAAEAIVDKVFDDERVRKRIFARQPHDKADAAAAARDNLRGFATRAFRRPVSAEELDRLVKLMAYARRQNASFEEAFKTALQAILASPHFLFRVEADPAADDADRIRELNDYELASRLSYFLWSSMPDEELFRLAGSGSLRDSEMLRGQVQRMLQDPKAVALTANFAGQWLQLRSLSDIAPDPERYPAFDEQLRTAMRRETELFFASVVREDRSVLEFLKAEYTYLNERLARHYGIEGVQGVGFRQVRLGDRRRGVLTHASILLITSNPTRTSPVKRGKWILDNILGEPPPPPPEGVQELDEDAETLGSLRERLEQHRSNESCAVCHRSMDSLGFGLENFDVVGAWRDRDGRFEVDAAGTLPGGLEFDGPVELMQILAGEKAKQFCRCLAEKLMTYALGRGLEPFDRCAVDDVMKELVANDFRFSAVATGIVLSDPFRYRELKGAE